MPRQDSIRFAILYSFYHLVEDRTARLFGRLVFDEFLRDLQVLTRGELPKLRNLRLDAQNLTVGFIGRFAGVEEEVEHGIQKIVS